MNTLTILQPLLSFYLVIYPVIFIKIILLELLLGGAILHILTFLAIHTAFSTAKRESVWVFIR